MSISAIVAISRNGVIGKQGGLPWHLPSEMAHFKQVTMGHTVVMGRKTYQSIGRALPGRQNIIISRDTNFQAPGCEIVGSLEQALAKAHDNSEVFIIGGASIYELSMPLINKVYMTIVDAEVSGDRFFNFDKHGWEIVASQKHQPDEKNKYAYEFQEWVRK